MFVAAWACGDALSGVPPRKRPVFEIHEEVVAGPASFVQIVGSPERAMCFGLPVSHRVQQVGNVLGKPESVRHGWSRAMGTDSEASRFSLCERNARGLRERAYSSSSFFPRSQTIDNASISACIFPFLIIIKNCKALLLFVSS